MVQKFLAPPAPQMRHQIHYKTAFLAFWIRNKAGIEDGF